MILRRLSDHLREQNWIAVALDFVIVVMGVYIGVLLGNWNETRQERQLYQQSYDRMIVELRGNIRSLEDKHESLREPLRIVQLAIEDLRACDTSESARERVEAAFSPMGIRHAFVLYTTAIDQLVDNEAFLPFQTPELREKLLSLSATVKSARQGSENVADGSVRVEPDLGLTEQGPLVYSGPDEIVEALRTGAPGSPQLVRRTLLKVPLGEACRNESFLASFYAWEDNTYYQMVFSEILAQRLRQELNGLTQTDGRPRPGPA